jgi:predicted aspartyl protease
MRVDGRWYRCPDSAIRPVFHVAVISADGTPVQRFFLVDTGADRTVFTRDLLDELGLPVIESLVPLEGVGGRFGTVDVVAEIRFRRDDGGEVVVRNRCAAMTDPGALDMSVLGRDIIELFALVFDRSAKTLCLVGQRHRYTISVA